MSAASFLERKELLLQAMRMQDAPLIQQRVAELETMDVPEARALSAWAYGLSSALVFDHAQALMHFERAAELYTDLNDPIAAARAMVGSGNVHFLLGHYVPALEQFQRAEAVFAEHDYRGGRISCLMNIGAVYANVGRYPEALDHYRRALDHYEAQHDERNIIDLLHNIGSLLSKMGEHREAIDHLQRAVAGYRELKEQNGEASALMNLAGVYMHISELAQSTSLFQKALALYEECNDLRGIAESLCGLGTVYHRADDYPLALEHYLKALDISTSLDDKVTMATLYVNLGALYLDTGAMQPARRACEQALALRMELGDARGVARVHQILADMDLDEGEYQAALERCALASTGFQSAGDGGGVIGTTVQVLRAHIALGSIVEAEDLLATLDTLVIVEPVLVIRREVSRSAILEHHGDLTEARRVLLAAQEQAQALGLLSNSAEIHERLREIALKLSDLPGYVTHNSEFTSIIERINGRATAQRFTMIEAERRIEAERAEKEKHRALLHNTLPPSIAERVLRGETVNDSFENAAVMFMDMVGFTTMSASMDPNEVVRLLSDIFTACDAIMAQHGLMKIKTIGDSYMAVAFSNTENQEPNTRHVVSSANAAVEVLRTLSAAHPDIRVRIGLHCGPVTAGVIGTERMQYDVWGDTVNVASRMESHGEPGRIHVSQTFATALRSVDSGRWTVDTSNDSMTNDSMTLLERGPIEIKGKGPMTTFWLSATHT